MISLSLSLSLSLFLLPPSHSSPLLSPAGIPLTSDDAVSIRQFELAQIVCDGTETSVSGCTINKVLASGVSQALVRCFQQTGTSARMATSFLQMGEVVFPSCMVSTQNTPWHLYTGWRLGNNMHCDQDACPNSWPLVE